MDNRGLTSSGAIYFLHGITFKRALVLTQPPTQCGFVLWNVVARVLRRHWTPSNAEIKNVVWRFRMLRALFPCLLTIFIMCCFRHTTNFTEFINWPFLIWLRIMTAGVRLWTLTSWETIRFIKPVLHGFVVSVISVLPKQFNCSASGAISVHIRDVSHVDGTEVYGSLRSTILPGFLDPWIWRHCIPSKGREIITQRCVIS